MGYQYSSGRITGLVLVVVFLIVFMGVYAVLGQELDFVEEETGLRPINIKGEEHVLTGGEEECGEYFLLVPNEDTGGMSITSRYILPEHIKRGFRLHAGKEMYPVMFLMPRERVLVFIEDSKYIPTAQVYDLDDPEMIRLTLRMSKSRYVDATRTDPNCLPIPINARPWEWKERDYAE